MLPVIGRVLGGVAPALEQGGDDRPDGDRQRERRRQGQQHREIEGARLDVGRVARRRSRSIARLIVGRIAVPSAVPMIDSGSWFSRSA